jgi:hypothetical protein
MKYFISFLKRSKTYENTDENPDLPMDFKILMKLFVILSKRFCLFVTSSSGKERSEFDRCNGWVDGRMCIMLPGFRDDYVCSSQPTGFLVSNHEVNKNKNDRPISSFLIRLFSF